MSETVRVRIKFDAVRFRRAVAEVSASLALLAAKDPKRRWKLQHRIARIRKHRGAV